MSVITKQRPMKVRSIDPEITVMLEAAGLLTPKDIKLADDADLESAGLSQGDIDEVRAVCPAYHG